MYHLFIKEINEISIQIHHSTPSFCPQPFPQPLRRRATSPAHNFVGKDANKTPVSGIWSRRLSFLLFWIFLFSWDASVSFLFRNSSVVSTLSKPLASSTCNLIRFYLIRSFIRQSRSIFSYLFLYLWMFFLRLTDYLKCSCSCVTVPVAWRC
jgi:hypothetical protein